MNPAVQSVKIPLNFEPSGTLGVLEFSAINFEPQRIYWLSNIPAGESRGKHAHKSLNQLFVLLQGTARVEIYRGRQIQVYELSEQGQGLALTPGLWRNIVNCSDDMVLLVICDQPYDERDYIRSFEEYVNWYEQNYV